MVEYVGMPIILWFSSERSNDVLIDYRYLRQAFIAEHSYQVNAKCCQSVRQLPSQMQVLNVQTKDQAD